MIRIVASLSLAIFTIIASTHIVLALSQSAEKANSGTVGIVTKAHGSSMRLVTEMAAELDQNEGLRVVPVLGQGALRNVDDLLYLKGIDGAIVQTDILATIPASEQAKLRYISRLHDEELHIVTRSDVNSIRELDGQKVNLVSKWGGAQLMATLVFQRAGINIEPVYIDTAMALQKVQSNEIAATVLITGGPARVFRQVSPEQGLHLLPVAYQTNLPKNYFPAKLTSEQYPGLIEKGKEVDTLAVGTALIIFDWTNNKWRFNKVARFVDSFLDGFTRFQKAPRDRKWREVNLGAVLPGWTRFSPVDDYLKRAAAIKKDDSGSRSLRRAFLTFLDQQSEAAGGRELTNVEKAELFQKFLSWQRSR